MTLSELIEILNNVAMLPRELQHRKVIETFCDYLKNPK